ncbi:MAG: hypothetical protein K2J16_00035 [Clostridia bacterium]|nr:hypothetical protein [Clostridia bacterium]
MANSRMRLISRILCLGFVLIMTLGILCACNKEDNFRNPQNGEPTLGEFYDLQTAYDNGWISKDDLRNLAYYLTGDAQKEGFEPAPRIPETLSPETEFAIKETHAKSLRDGYPEAIASDVRIEAYYGTYNGFVAVIISAKYYAFPAVIHDETIDGIKFRYPYPNTIRLWKQTA